jgi:hypothetical protein
MDLRQMKKEGRGGERERREQVLMKVHSTQNYRVFGHYPMFGVLKPRKNVLETESISVLR